MESNHTFAMRTYCHHAFIRLERSHALETKAIQRNNNSGASGGNRTPIIGLEDPCPIR
jgi:hypothetical protein